MENEGAEMSLDDVLSSIKKMVIDEEPPVLELTEMVSDDGSIVSLKKSSATSDPVEKKNDMSAFLKLIQEGAPTPLKMKNNSAEVMPSTVDTSSSRATQLSEKRKPEVSPSPSFSSSPSLSPKSKSNSNGSSVAGNVVMHDLILEALTPILNDWISKNLSQLVKEAVEKEVRNFLYKNRN